MRVTLEPITADAAPWDAIARSTRSSVFRTRAWVDYLAVTQAGSPVVCEVLHDGEPAGWFVGVRTRRFGLRMLGSPLPGWGTSYMGFAWDQNAMWSDQDRLESLALVALRRWAIDRGRFTHLEVMVEQPPERLALPPAMQCSPFHSYRCTLGDDDTMLSAMSTNARRNIRRAVGRGLRVETVPSTSAAGFAAEYYDMALQAFARRGTRPSYSLERIRQMIDTVGPTGNLLLLRAVTERGELAATSITAGMSGGTAVFLMGAGEQAHTDARPNDAIMWSAMQIWRDQGAVEFDFGGGGDYKQKFGGQPVVSTWVRASVLPGASRIRELVRRAEAARRRTRCGPPTACRR